ncbi:hypothetical protein K466DRAFT_570281 [Polyporus arcularius HHB13444]|uniref:Uncharacterized protein n=1 Tax=Polyporus arcularius HHB13444 TaxID=1314778 RepID=A0A5C3NTM8_9APHY|nr:hypothetical protein K466DRAFT_570281 [Polyporus arcularius HHB13444]
MTKIHFTRPSLGTRMGFVGYLRMGFHDIHPWKSWVLPRQINELTLRNGGGLQGGRRCLHVLTVVGLMLAMMTTRGLCSRHLDGRRQDLNARQERAECKGSDGDSSKTSSKSLAVVIGEVEEVAHKQGGGLEGGWLRMSKVESKRGQQSDTALDLANAVLNLADAILNLTNTIYLCPPTLAGQFGLQVQSHAHVNQSQAPYLCVHKRNKPQYYPQDDTLQEVVCVSNPEKARTTQNSSLTRASQSDWAYVQNLWARTCT